MMSLFSSFDSYFFFLWSFICTFFVLFLNFKTYLINFNVNFFNLFYKNMENFFQSNKNSFFSKFSYVFFVTILFFIFFMNFFSLMPYSFTVTGQVSIVLFLAFSSWSLIFFFYSMMNFKMFFSHCIPEGSPLPITILLFLIELVSTLIRPITLTVRLAANVVAGHVIMHLIFMLLSSYSFVFFVYVFINILEFFVCFIQAWIFSTLISLYYSEVL